MILKMAELEGQGIPLSPGFPISVGQLLHSLKIINTRYNSNCHGPKMKIILFPRPIYVKIIF